MTNIDGIKLLHVDVNFNPQDASKADLITKLDNQ